MNFRELRIAHGERIRNPSFQSGAFAKGGRNRESTTTERDVGRVGRELRRLRITINGTCNREALTRISQRREGGREERRERARDAKGDRNVSRVVATRPLYLK